MPESYLESTGDNTGENKDIKSDEIFEFKDLESAEEYLQWKESVPLEFRKLIEGKMRGSISNKISNTGLPLSDQFLNSLRSILVGKKFEEGKIDERVLNLVKNFNRVSTEAGYINPIDYLVNPDVSWQKKIEIYETQFKSALEWLSARDVEDFVKKSEEGDKGEKNNNDIPPHDEETSSSMESGTEKREGAPKAHFSVYPFFGGYYSKNVLHEFNHNTGRWGKKNEELSKAEKAEIDPLSIRVLSGTIKGGNSVSIPLPDNWSLDFENIEINTPLDQVSFNRNEDGSWIMKVDAEGTFSYKIKIGRLLISEQDSQTEKAVISPELPEELKAKINEFKAENLPKMKLYRKVTKFIKDSLTYSNSPEAWKKYTENPENFFKELWNRKEADCFVANTLAIKVLQELGATCSFVAGYSVREKDESGSAIMHSGNGHAWFKVWDSLSRRWIRLDATPKGDPGVDEEEQEKSLNDGEEGDYGENDEEVASEEKIKKEIEKKKKEKGSGGKGKSGKVFNMIENEFSELAGCSENQAREFLEALERIRAIKDENGAIISDLLLKEWQKVVTARMVEKDEYRGPVRMDEGDYLEDVVDASIDIRSRENNPTGFERVVKEEKLETDFGGLNLYFSFDLSGSMDQTDSATGRKKCDVQRDVALLFIDSIMQCAILSKRFSSGNSDTLPIKIMVTVASSVGEVKLPLTDKWGPKEQWALYQALKQIASGGTPTHETLEKIETTFDLEKKIEKDKRITDDKKPIHYTAEISDGAPDDFSETENKHRELKKKGMIIRSYVIGGQSGSEDAAPPLDSFSQLPGILSKDIRELFSKLKPHIIKK
ncbi:MAG: transglutaminase domain-containing protein [bacterium]|nr:transglutaminase domain-containing protein [bacterium]